jgi:hypothetical protein
MRWKGSVDKQQQASSAPASGTWRVGGSVFVSLVETRLMQPLRRLFTPLLIVLIAIPARALAQDRHVISRSAIADAVAEHVAQEQADRATIREALGQPEVRALAARTGVDAERLGTLAGMLNGSDLKAVANEARAVNESLVGGASTVTLSTTTIIIGLLVLILIIVAVK